MNKKVSIVGAIVLSVLSAVYMIAALVSGHDATASPPPDLTVGQAEKAIDQWKLANLLLEGDSAVIIDTRSEQAYADFHVPGSVSLPDPSAPEVAAQAKGKSVAVIVADKDKDAQKLLGTVGELEGTSLHYLKNGARDFYLTFELPVPLFTEAKVPSGWREAAQGVKAALDGTAPKDAKAKALLASMVKSKLEPTLLGQKKKPKSSGKKKKLSGGCE